MTDFRTQFWDFYDELLVYQQHPTAEESTRLEARFDKLFSTCTGYDALDARIAKTRDKKASLLMVLKHPEVPLHNNPAELEARQRVRKREISFGARTPEDLKAWDTFMSLAATTTKLGISFCQFLIASRVVCAISRFVLYCSRAVLKFAQGSGRPPPYTHRTTAARPQPASCRPERRRPRERSRGSEPPAPAPGAPTHSRPRKEQPAWLGRP